MYIDNYVIKSLELHLFFGRIMKEHSLFLRAGFTPANPSFSNKAEFYKIEFEKLLNRAISLGNGIVTQNVLDSGELVTEFTLLAEQQTEKFTGININKTLTEKELNLNSDMRRSHINQKMRIDVKRLNQTALNLLDGLINFKELTLKNVLHCEMFTMNYPLLIEHIIREAKLYRKYVDTLEREGYLNDDSMKKVECFWNQIMMEHAMFIRGLLDPSEEELINSANGFAKEYAKLLDSCNDAQSQTIKASSLEETVKFKEFKTAGTKGIEQCEIRSVILPLLADHVLREANHYIRLLKS
ncbi:MAG: DUF2935 domain-containing protein [Acutalibacteraceae bacterium]